MTFRNVVVRSICASLLVLISILMLAPAHPTQAAVVFSNWAAVRPPSLTGAQLSADFWHAVGFTVPAGTDYRVNSLTVSGLSRLFSTIDMTFDLYDLGSGGRPGSFLATFGTQAAAGSGSTLVFAPGSMILAAGATYFVVGRAPGVTETAVWHDTDPVTRPSGVFAYAGDYNTTSGGGSWSTTSMSVALEIDAAPVEEGAAEDGVVSSIPGCDMVYLPPTAVVGAFIADAELNYAPVPDAGTDVIMAAGKTAWVFGVDETGTFYKIVWGCRYYWVPVGAMGPNHDGVWHGSPLPTGIVE